MKDFLRLVFVAILSFLIVGLALYASKDSEALHRLTAFATSHLQHPQDEKTDNIETASIGHSATSKIWIPRPQQDEWVGIAGFPDTVEMRFSIPRGINLTGGRLVLELNSQLSTAGDGRITIAVNQTRRGEVVLNPGQSTHEIDIDLTPSDLRSNTLLVQLDGQGSTGGGQICPNGTTNSGSAISVSRQSGLELYTTDAPQGLEVRLATLADPARLVLGTSPAEQARAIWAAQALARAGVSTNFVSDDENADLVATASGNQALALDPLGRIALGGDAGIQALIDYHANADQTAHALTWPISAQALGAETDSKNFRGSRRWSLDYGLPKLAGGDLPEHVHVAIKTSLLKPGNDWVTRLSLNGNLIKTTRTSGQSDTINILADLPATKQGLFNSLLVELIDTSPNASICRNGPDAEAQLLPTTSLEGANASATSGWPAMVHLLASQPEIGLDLVDTLTAGQADSAANLLDGFVPSDANIAFGTNAQNAKVTLKITTGAHLRSALGLSQDIGGTLKSVDMVSAGDQLGPSLVDLQSDAGKAALSRLGDGEVVILIATPNEND